MIEDNQQHYKVNECMKSVKQLLSIFLNTQIEMCIKVLSVKDVS